MPWNLDTCSCWNAEWLESTTRVRPFIPGTGIQLLEWPFQKHSGSGLTTSAPLSNVSAPAHHKRCVTLLQPVSVVQKNRLLTMLSSNVQSIDLPMDCTAWRFWTMRQSNGCSTLAARSNAAKQWFGRTGSNDDEGYALTSGSSPTGLKQRPRRDCWTAGRVYTVAAPLTLRIYWPEIYSSVKCVTDESCRFNWLLFANVFMQHLNRNSNTNRFAVEWDVDGLQVYEKRIIFVFLEMHLCVLRKQTWTLHCRRWKI